MKPANWIAAIAVGVALFSVLRGSGAQTHEIGRYQISASPNGPVWMVDTATGQFYYCNLSGSTPRCSPNFR